MWKSKKKEEPIIINSKDWSKEEFNTICKVLNLASHSTKMIVLRENFFCEYEEEE